MPSSLEGEVHTWCVLQNTEHSSGQLLIQAFPMEEGTHAGRINALRSLDFSSCLQLIARPTITSSLKHSLVSIVRLPGLNNTRKWDPGVEQNLSFYSPHHLRGNCDPFFLFSFLLCLDLNTHSLGCRAGGDLNEPGLC